MCAGTTNGKAIWATAYVNRRQRHICCAVGRLRTAAALPEAFTEATASTSLSVQPHVPSTTLLSMQSALIAPVTHHT